MNLIKIPSRLATNLLRRLYRFFIQPKSNNEDKARSEFILNILLSGSALLLLAILGLCFVRFIIDHGELSDRGFHPLVFLILLFLVLLSWLLGRKGRIKTASLIFLSIFFLPNLYLSFYWGIDLPQSLLLYAFSIIAAGILINARFAFRLFTFIAIYLGSLGYLQGHGIIKPNTYWTSEMVNVFDAVPIIITLFIMAGIAWLSARELEKSLNRARSSEIALRKERDSLEVKVEKRTEELRRLQMEKVGQLYRFAEFGRLSGGIFHDLINPLTAVSLNLEGIDNQNDLTKAQENIKQAVAAAKKMELLVAGVKTQIQAQESLCYFSVNQEIKNILAIISYKARKAKTIIRFKYREETHLYGDPLKFSQIILNLVSNSLDSLENKKNDDRKIIIRLTSGRRRIIIKVEDNGPGIAPEILPQIFTPFFSTKLGKGLGLGLSSVKHLIEQDFAGDLKVSSNLEKFCRFTLTLRRRENLYEEKSAKPREKS